MSAEWKRLTILWPDDGTFPPHRPRDGHEAHKFCAMTAASFEDDVRCKVPSALFHHIDHPELGRIADHGLSPIRYSANRRGISITAVGDAAVDVLSESGHRLTRAFARLAGQPLREQWASGHVRWSSARKMQSYKAHHLVFTRKPAHLLGSLESDLRANNVTPEITELLETRIGIGLQRQASLLGLDELQVEPLLRVSAVGHLSGWNRNGKFFGLVAHDVLFQADLQLQGPWHVGSLCLLGCGAVSSLQES